MENIIGYVYVLFSATVLLSVWLFIKAADYSKTVMLLVAVWVIIQSAACMMPA